MDEDLELSEEENDTAVMTVDPHISVCIPYHSNTTGLAVTLATLQAQVLPPSKIIVIDTSPDKSGWDICKRYQTNVKIICEVAKTPIYESWNRGIELAGDDDVLIINDDLLFPINFIDVLFVVKHSVPALCYVPITPSREHSADYVNTNFEWWAEVPSSLEQLTETFWMPGFCFMLSRQAIKEIGTFDTRFKVWFGDDDYQARLHEAAGRLKVPAIVQIKPLFAYHYGGSSFKYHSKEVQKKISVDRKAYLAKYGERKPEVKGA